MNNELTAEDVLIWIVIIAIGLFVGRSSRKGIADLNLIARSFLEACKQSPRKRLRQISNGDVQVIGCFPSEFTDTECLEKINIVAEPTEEQHRIAYLKEQNRILKAELDRRFKIRVIYVLILGAICSGWVYFKYLT